MSEEKNVKKSREYLGLFSVICGILSTVSAPMFLRGYRILIPGSLSAVTLILGLVARYKEGKGELSMVGIILGIVGLVFYLALLGLAVFFWMSMAYSKT